MLGAAKQGVSWSIRKTTRNCLRARRIFEYLSRGIGVSRGQRQFRANPSLQLKFGAVSERSLQVEKLVLARRIGYGLNLVMEEIIEIGCVQGPAARKQSLLEASFKSSRALRQQAVVRGVAICSIAKSLVESGFHK